MPICTCHFASPVKRFAKDFLLWLNQSWKSSVNNLKYEQKIVIHKQPYTFQYILHQDHKWLQWIRAVIQYSTHHIIFLLMPLKSLCMMMSSNGNISALLACYIGNSWVTSEFASQKPVAQSFDIFFDLCQNKQLSKQSRHQRFELPLCSLWHHCNRQFGFVLSLASTIHCYD